MSTDVTPPQSPRSPLWMRLLLFVSLALNLLVAGLVIGAIFSGGHNERGKSPGNGAFRMPYVAALDHSDKRALSRELRQQMRAAGAGRAQTRAGFAKSIELLRADPFDAEAFQAQVTTQFSATKTRDEAGRAALIALIAGMSAEERMQYADRLAQVLERGPRKRKP